MVKKQIQTRMKKLIVPLDKLSNDLFKLPAEFYAKILNGEPMRIKERFKDNGRGVFTEYWLKLAEGFLDKSPLEPFHREVLFAFLSAYEQGYDTVTFKMTLNALTGTNKSRMYKNQFEALNEAVKKLQSIRITIDATMLFEAEPKYKARYGRGSAKLTGYLLPCEIVEAEVNGREKTHAVKLLGESPLMRLAKAKAQLVSYDNAPLAISGQNNTPLVIVIKNWLLRRIHTTKSERRKRGLNPSILFSTLYVECGIKDKPLERKRGREIIFETLDAFKAEGVIEDYSVEREGNNYRSIRLKTH